MFTCTHLFVLRRGRTGVEIVHLIGPAQCQSVISLHCNFNWRVLSQTHPFLAEDTERRATVLVKMTHITTELNVYTSVYLTCLGSWGCRCSKSKSPPTLLHLDRTQWWRLHHARRCPHVSPTGQSSKYSPVDTHTHRGGDGGRGYRTKGWKQWQNAFYFTVM